MIKSKCVGYRLLTVLLAFVMVSSLIVGVSLSAHATDSAQSEEYQKAKTDIMNAVAEFQKEVDIKQYKLSIKEVKAVMNDIFYGCPEFFYLDSSWSYQYDNNNRVISILLNYEYSSKAKIRAAVAEYEVLLTGFIEDCGIKSGYSDFEKVLAVHDKIIADYQYDMTYVNHDAYVMLRDGVGVCEAYSLLFTAVMNHYGVENRIILSVEKNHCWNAVKIDGSWYHIDLTWDDPTLNHKRSTLSRNYFLLSNTDIAAADGSDDTHDGPFDLSAPKSYDTSLIKNVETRMLNINGVWYGVDSETGTLNTYDFKNKTVGKICDIAQRWFLPQSNTTYYPGCYSGLGYYDGMLYFNTSERIFCIPIDGGKAVAVLTPDTSKKVIYGLKVEGDTLHYYLAYDPNATAEVKSIPLSELTVPDTTPEVTTKVPDVTTKVPEVTTKVPEVTTKVPEVTTKVPDVTTKVPDVTTKVPEVTTKVPDVTTKVPEVTTKVPEVTTKVPEVTTKVPEVTTKVPEVTTKAPEVTTKVPEVTTKVPDVATKVPDITDDSTSGADITFTDEVSSSVITGALPTEDSTEYPIIEESSDDQSAGDDTTRIDYENLFGCSTYVSAGSVIFIAVSVALIGNAEIRRKNK